MESASLLKNLVCCSHCGQETPQIKNILLKCLEVAEENQQLTIEIQQLKKEGNKNLHNTVYVASLIRNRFHYPNCEWAEKISPSNIIEFSSREEAISKGFKPCWKCCS